MIQLAELQVSLPGTNTAEATYLQTPMIVIAPLNYPELIILDGILGLITKIPILGKLILKIAVKILKRKIKYVSLPNRMANEAIVPEIIDIITPEKIRDSVLKFSTNNELLSDMKVRLEKLRETRSPSETISLEIIKEI